MFSLFRVDELDSDSGWKHNLTEMMAIEAMALDEARVAFYLTQRGCLGQAGRPRFRVLVLICIDAEFCH